MCSKFSLDFSWCLIQSRLCHEQVCCLGNLMRSLHMLSTDEFSFSLKIMTWRWLNPWVRDPQVGLTVLSGSGWLSAYQCQGLDVCPQDHMLQAWSWGATARWRCLEEAGPSGVLQVAGDMPWRGGGTQPLPHSLLLHGLWHGKWSPPLCLTMPQVKTSGPTNYKQNLQACKPKWTFTPYKLIISNISL